MLLTIPIAHGAQAAHRWPRYLDNFENNLRQTALPRQTSIFKLRTKCCSRMLQNRWICCADSWQRVEVLKWTTFVVGTLFSGGL